MPSTVNSLQEVLSGGLIEPDSMVDIIRDDLSALENDENRNPGTVAFDPEISRLAEFERNRLRHVEQNFIVERLQKG